MYEKFSRQGYSTVPDPFQDFATDVPLMACIIDSSRTFTYYLDLSNSILEFGLSHFTVLTICLLLLYFVTAAGYHFLTYIPMWMKLAKYSFENLLYITKVTT